MREECFCEETLFSFYIPPLFSPVICQDMRLIREGKD